MTILTLGCSNKPVEKEMKMPMLSDNRGQAEKEVYKFGCKGAHQVKKNGCHSVCTNTSIKNECLISPIFINLELFFCRDLLHPLFERFLMEFILLSRILIK